MTQRFDICTGRPGRDGKTFWTKIGFMTSNDKEGFSIKLDALPLPDKDGNVWINAFPPREPNGGGNRAAPRQSRSNPNDQLDDAVPW
jgi:hypothetical protein